MYYVLIITLLISAAAGVKFVVGVAAQINTQPILQGDVTGPMVKI